MPGRRPRLFVLPPSHFCERARWALDRANIGYAEVCWAVGVHAPLARRLAGATTLPILDTGREIIQGSGSILDWVGLPGGDPALERRFAERIGPLVRQYLYAATLSGPGAGVRALLFDGVPRWQSVAGRLAWPALRRAMIVSMNARPELAPGLARDLAAELDWFESWLRHHDGRFGRAELTAASLLAPLARPVECPLYRALRLPDETEAMLLAWSARPSLQWVVRAYAQHRR